MMMMIIIIIIIIISYNNECPKWFGKRPHRRTVTPRWRYIRPPQKPFPWVNWTFV